MLGTRADDRTLTGQDPTTESVGDVAVAAADQGGERVVRALPAAVPSQDPVGGATTGGRATVTGRAPLNPDTWPVPSAPSLRAGPSCVGAGTMGGPTSSWSSHHAWSLTQGKGGDHLGPTGPISRLKRGTNVGPWLWS